MHQPSHASTPAHGVLAQTGFFLSQYQHAPQPDPIRVTSGARHRLVFQAGSASQVSRKISGEPMQRGLITPDYFCLLPAGQEAQLDWTARCGSVFVEIEESILLGLSTQLQGKKAMPGPLFNQADPLLVSLLAALRHALTVPLTDPLYYQSLTQCFVAQLLTLHVPAPDAPSYRLNNAQLKRVSDYVGAHLGEKISLETLAGLVDLSPYYFIRQFRAATGQTPYQYLIRVRLETACRLLRQTKLPVVTIALTCGFYDAQQFTRLFKARFRLTPGEFRSQWSGRRNPDHG